MESVLRELFDAPELDLERLRDVAARGVPDNLRATVWKFLLGYTPLRKAKREATVAASREQYVVFLDEVVTRPQHDPDEAAVAAQSPAPEASSTGGGTAPSSSMPVSPALGSPSSGGSPELRPVHLKRLEVVDDPLAHAATATAATAPEGGSKWEQWHLDEELRVEIDKDIQRTNPSFHFFCEERNLDAMRRILFVYAKLNAGVRYVQGMNEVLAPLYWALATDPEGATDRAGAEADTFFCFMFVMSEVRDLFIKSQDSCSTGVYGLLRRFSDILARREPLLAAHHAALRIEPTYYAFRWVTTLLSREFELPDVLMIWDCLFADRHRYLLLLHLCAAMLRCQRPALLAADFGRTLKLLQNYPPVDTRVLIDAAYNIREEEGRDGVDPRPTTESPAPASRARPGPASAAASVHAPRKVLPPPDDAASAGRLSAGVSSAISSAAGVAGSVTSAAWGFLSSLSSTPVAGKLSAGTPISSSAPLAGRGGQPSFAGGGRDAEPDEGQPLATMRLFTKLSAQAGAGVRLGAAPSE